MRASFFITVNGTILAFLLVALLLAPIASAVTVPLGFARSSVVTGLDQPVAFTFAPDGRIFITEKTGHVRIVENGTLLTQPFASFTVQTDGERGLLGITLDPNFSSNRYVYVYYTADTSPRHNMIVRVTADSGNPNVMQTGTEQTILQLDDLTAATNHNGGALHFGADGKLYASTGENANTAHSQVFTNLHGKILRMNADGSIPTDNPFYGSATGNNRMIYALGLRNPFTFGVDPSNGRIYVNDVGFGTWEEINELTAGKNYGWNICEGVCSPSNPSYEDPIFTYNHTVGTITGFSIAGAAFYRGSTFPSQYTGDYFFGDYVNGWIRSIDTTTRTVSDFVTSGGNPTDIRIGPDGALYYISLDNGTLYKVSYGAPTPTQAPVNPYRYEGVAYYVDTGSAGGFTSPVYRFNSSRGVHFYTASETEKNNTISNFSNRWTYEGVAYYVSTSAGAGKTPVYRFRDEALGVHFYTASETEKTNTIENFSNKWTYEGVAYYVAVPPDQGTKSPVYRFGHRPTGAHFYTASESEKDSIYIRSTASQ